MSDRDTVLPTTEGKAPSPPPRRSRSRSPPRKSKKTSGFKWKQKPSNAEADDNRRDGRDDRRPRYDDDRRGPSSRSNYRDDYRRDNRGDDNYRPGDRAGDRGGYRDRDDARRRSRREKKEKAPAPAPAVAADGEEMIIVHVNDRLGTKAAIPCFGSDNVGAFKVMVAARIGREPHEILLKRQGERPFKDHISLADYGVSNGVQLDLEVDTGD
ncbi:hypothetical protein VPNG_05085 [Cytospora leucostoma]|uniref:Ubiquitin-like modifier HUB1 n=1 Tax=Cytospora leucostoma TaxID=1230097 RepID=A0A423X4F8_9PEZI|nr:hypothetical protein VPNG_05085 [Cytospora leucostoma]